MKDGRRRGKDDGGGNPAYDSASGTMSGPYAERVPSRMHQMIRLGKRSHVECATFLPDGTGLITGSSDGFIEVWGETGRKSSSSSSDVVAGGGGGTDDVDYEALRTSDLPYQRDDDLMMHDSSVLAVDVSNDGTLLGTTSSNGTVCVWKLKDGRMLRKLERAHGGIVGPGGGDGGEFFFSFFPPLRERSAAFYGNIHFVSVEWNSVSNSMVPYTHARIIRTRTHPQGPP